MPPTSRIFSLSLSFFLWFSLKPLVSFTFQKRSRKCSFFSLNIHNSSLFILFSNIYLFYIPIFSLSRYVSTNLLFIFVSSFSSMFSFFFVFLPLVFLYVGYVALSGRLGITFSFSHRTKQQSEKSVSLISRIRQE